MRIRNPDIVMRIRNPDTVMLMRIAESGYGDAEADPES
jgi:hypothetical protein